MDKYYCIPYTNNGELKVPSRRAGMVDMYKEKIPHHN
jgi:hypothetical protein